MFRNDSMCYQQTCEDMIIPDDCDEYVYPQCVCPESMLLKDGECVDLDECYVCEVRAIDGDTKRVSVICDVTCFRRSPISADNIDIPLTSFSLARVHS